MSIDREAIVERARARFDEASRAAGREVVALEIARRAVRLEFAGTALTSRVVPALAHLAVPEADSAQRPDLTIHLWDAASTGVGMIESPWYPLELGAGGYVPAAAAVGLSVHCRVDTGMVTLLDPEAGIAFLWIERAELLSRYEAAAPLRQVFSAYFAHRGACVAHGAAVGLGGRGVLLGGRGGSGKSTTALLCLEAGFDYAGDDYVLVDAGSAEAGAAPWVHGLYSTGKVMDAAMTGHFGVARAFDELHGEAPADEKAIAYLHGRLGGARGRLSRGFELAALVLPVVTGARDTHARRIPGGEGLRGLAPSTVFQHGGGGLGMLATLARVAARVPCVRLELGTDLTQIPACLGRVIEAGGASP